MLSTYTFSRCICFYVKYGVDNKSMRLDVLTDHETGREDIYGSDRQIHQQLTYMDHIHPRANYSMMRSIMSIPSDASGWLGEKNVKGSCAALPLEVAASASKLNAFRSILGRGLDEDMGIGRGVG